MVKYVRWRLTKPRRLQNTRTLINKQRNRSNEIRQWLRIIETSGTCMTWSSFRATFWNRTNHGNEYDWEKMSIEARTQGKMLNCNCSIKSQKEISIPRFNRETWNTHAKRKHDGMEEKMTSTMMEKTEKIEHSICFLLALIQRIRECCISWSHRKEERKKERKKERRRIVLIDDFNEGKHFTERELRTMWYWNCLRTFCGIW
jgi:hypothetical protein